jgi:hypothetical protein
MLRSRSLPRRAGGAALTALVVALAGSLAGGAARDALRLPPIVFVSRAPITGAPGAVPGLGPHQRDVITGGRLLLRAPDGAIRELAPGVLRDASDPAVSPDGRRVLFAGVRAGRDEGWRLFIYELASDRLDTTLVAAGAAFDPCWISDSAAVVVRVDPRATGQYRDAPVTQLWIMRIPPQAAPAVRITSERNGAEEPAWDATTGRIVYARWWYNRWRPSDDPATHGVTFEPARAFGDSVNLWQIVSVRPDGSGARIEASGLANRLASMGTQPAVLADGDLRRQPRPLARAGRTWAPALRAAHRGRAAHGRRVDRDRTHVRHAARTRRAGRVRCGRAARRPGAVLVRPGHPRRLRAVRDAARRKPDHEGDRPARHARAGRCAGRGAPGSVGAARDGQRGDGRDVPLLRP